MNDVYIVGTGEFLPNDPVSNDAMPSYLGVVSPALERVRNVVLKQNGIKQRYYAVDTNGKPTHSTAEIAGRAIVAASEACGRSLETVEFLSAGTTMGDVLIPSFAAMCHGWLKPHGIRSIHVHPVEGVCCNATHALEAANIFLKSGKYKNAIVATGERASAGLRAERYQQEYPARNENIKSADGYQYLDGEFLRYMLSDGGGALYLTTQRRPNEDALRIDWIETISYANELPTCMFMGSLDPDAYSPSGSWLNQSYQDAARSGTLVLRQNTDVLKENISIQFLRFIEQLVESGQLDLSKISLIAGHISSNYLKEHFQKIMEEQGRVKLPAEYLYTNLETKGNMGSASPLILIHDVFTQKLLEPGQSGILICPESGRFTYSVCQFTRV